MKLRCGRGTNDTHTALYVMQRSWTFSFGLVVSKEACECAKYYEWKRKLELLLVSFLCHPCKFKFLYVFYYKLVQELMYDI